MVGNILTGSEKSQLLAIQNSQRTIDRVQENLATGKNVNRAIQDPQNFFTSTALSNRASDLNRLLDGINQGINVVKETVTGIETIQELLDLADALLLEADLALKASGEPLPNVTANNQADVEIYDAAQNGAGTVTLGNGGQSIAFDGNLWRRIDIDYEITANTVLRFEYQSGNIPEISAIGFDDDTNFTNDNDRFFIYGTQLGGISYSAPTNTFEYSGSGDFETIEIPVGNFFQGNFDYITFVHDDDGPGDDGDATFNNITLFESDTDFTDALAGPIEEFETRYNEILRQIDFLVQDANYRGINLLKNETLDVLFNEDLTSRLTLEGINSTSLGLGITEANFTLRSALRQSQDQIGQARQILREYTFSLQNDLSVITARENFTRDIVNNLKAGSDDLVLADQNEEGANLLALQTRQQLQFSNLSFASQQRNIAEFL